MKILKAEGLGERVFSDEHAARLLALPNSQWQFVRNDPNHERNTGTAEEAEPPADVRSGDDTAGQDQATRETTPSRKRKRKKPQEDA